MFASVALRKLILTACIRDLLSLPTDRGYSLHFQKTQPRPGLQTEKIMTR